MKNTIFVVVAFGFFMSAESVNAFMHDKLIKEMEGIAKNLNQNQQRKQNSKLAVCPGSPTSDGRQVRNWINCKGTLITSKGIKFSGKWERGRLQGKVIITTPEGITVWGNYKDSKLIGKHQIIKSGSKNKNDKSDKVFDREAERKIIENTLSSGLEVKNVCRILPVWRIKRSKDFVKGYFFLPVLPKSYFIIGGYGTQNDKKGTHCVKVVKSVGINSSTNLLAPPKDWELIWNSGGTGARKDGSFWSAIPSNDNYTCVGSVAQNGFEKPNVPSYRCVHSSLVNEVKTDNLLWWDWRLKSGNRVSLFALPESNTIVAVEGRYDEVEVFDLKKNLLVKPDENIVEAKLTERETEWKKREAEKRRELAKREAEKRRELAKKRKKEQARLEDRRRKIAADKKRAEDKIAADKKRAEEERRALLEGDINRTAVSQLFVGDPKDIVFLTNSRSKDVTRGLSGKIKIISSVARACAIGPTKFTPNSTRFEKETFEQLLNAIKPTIFNQNSFEGRKIGRVRPCKNLNVEKSEIVFLSRDISSSVSFDTLSILIKNTREGTYGFLHVGDYQGFDAKVQSEKKAALELARKRNERQIQIKNGISNGSMTGFGMFELKRAKSNAICIEEGNSRRDIIQILQKDILKNGNGTYWQDRFTKMRISPIRIEVGDLEKIFLSLKTQKCGSFFGKTESIKILSSALKRDKLTPQILPVLLSSNFVVERRNKILAEKQKLDQERKLRKQKVQATQKTKSTSSGSGYGLGPAQQIFMTEFITRIKTKYVFDDNSAKIKNIWINASNELCSSKEFDAFGEKVNWVGYVDMIIASDDGRIHLELDIDTHGNEVHDFAIAESLKNTVLDLKDGGIFSKGEMVRFSGNFKKGKRSENECLSGGIDSNPELLDEGFDFTFTKIEKITN